MGHWIVPFLIEQFLCSYNSFCNWASWDKNGKDYPSLWSKALADNQPGSGKHFPWYSCPCVLWGIFVAVFLLKHLKYQLPPPSLNKHAGVKWTIDLLQHGFAGVLMTKPINWNKADSQKEWEVRVSKAFYSRKVLVLSCYLTGTTVI